MAVTKQTYTATPTWTASGLATLFQAAFIDAGLMTSWYDSFTSSAIENRILQVVYDGSKTYGTTYYWFMFTTSGVFIHTALGWNATTHVPTGTQYLDYYATTTNATTNHRQLVSLTSTTSVTLTRYTSAVDPDCSYFVIRNGSTSSNFHVPSSGFGPLPFVDLNKMAFNCILSNGTSTGSSISYINSRHVASITRRTIFGSTILKSSTTSSHYTVSPLLFGYEALGAQTNAGGGNIDVNYPYFPLPTAIATVQTGLAADHTPVFTGPQLSFYQSAFPSDFAIASYYASNAMAVQDTFIVSSGVEEYDILVASTNSTSEAGRLLLLARTV